MSYSLQLSHGDFTVAAAQLGIVTDEQKLVQDLRCALLEPMGTDDMHLDYGSLIDGGTLPDGTVAPGAIGITNVNQAAATVQAEITRVTTNYQSQQLTRAKDDQTVYGRVSLSPAEALLSVTNVSMEQQTDSLIVTVTLQTGRGEPITFAIPIGNG